MPPKRTETSEVVPAARTNLNRRPSANTSNNGVEVHIDPDAPREGRLASLKTRPAVQNKSPAPKIAFKPKAVQRRKKDGTSESLLNIGTNEDGDTPSDSRIRRAERGRGRGRGRGGARVEAPLVASGPFAQGPALSTVPLGRAGPKTSGISRGAGASQTPVIHRSSVGPRKEKLDEAEAENEANLDDTGQPMQNLLRMHHDTSDYWAPITTERIERAPKEAQIAQPGQEMKRVKVKREAEDLGFIDVKTEPTESTLTSRAPTPTTDHTAEADSVMGDTNAPSHKLNSQEEDEDDIALPGISEESKTNPPEVLDVKTKVERERKKASTRVMTVEEAEEQERLSADLQSLRMSLNRESGTLDNNLERLIFIQLPEILPLWKPGEEEVKDDTLIKEETTKPEIVEIDQKEQDRSKEASASAGSQAGVESSSGRVGGTGATAGAATETGGSKQEPEVKNEVGADPNSSEAKTAGEPSKRKKRKPKNVSFPPPEGFLGQLHIHRSGKMTCDWGGISMDVGTGSDCGFLQEVVAIDPRTDRKAWSLGTVDLRVMMSPNLDDLLGQRG